MMLNGDYMPETFGGAQQQCGKVSAELVERGYGVIVFTNRTSKKTLKNEVNKGVVIVRPYTIYSPQLLGKYVIASVIWLFYWLAWAYRKRHDIDVIHVHQAKFQAFLGCVAGQLFGIPVVVKLGNAGEHNDLDRLGAKKVFGGFLKEYVIRHTTMFIAISSQIRRELEALGIKSSRIELIFNGVNPTQAGAIGVKNKREAKAQLGIPSDSMMYVFAGRFEPIKNLENALQSFIEFEAANRVPSKQFFLIGDGMLASRLISQSAGLAGAIEFTGELTDVSSYFLAADFVVSPSLAEGMSNSVLEAMAMGAIPLTTAVSGAEDLVVPGVTGWIAEAFDVNSLLAMFQCSTLSEQELLEMQLANLDRIDNIFSMGRTVDSLERLYADLA